MAKLLIVYDTYTGRTGKMAEAVAAGAAQVEGVEVATKRVSQTTWQDLEGVAAIILGSPTRNTQVGPDMRTFLKLLDRAPLRGVLGAAFGSYGWSGEAVGKLNTELRARGVRVVADGVRCKLEPSAATLEACRELGRMVAEQAKSWSQGGPDDG